MSDIDLGLFQGGVARQRNTNRQIGIQERAVGIQEEQLEHQRRTQVRNEVMEAIGNTTDQAVSLVQGSGSRDSPGFADTLSQIRANVEALATQAEQAGVGITANSVLQTFDNAVLSSQTATEKSQAEAQGTVAGAQETVSAVGGGNRELGILLGTEPLTEPDIVRIQEARDAAERAGDTQRAQELTDIIQKRGTVTGRTEQDLAAGEGFSTALTTPTEGDIERLRTNIRENQTGFETAANTLQRVEDAGALAVGFAGAATEGFTGLAGNFGAVGDAIKAGFETVTGADLAKLTAARTSMREGVSSALSEITDEEGSRFTDTERELANDVLRGLNADADIDQVVAAYREYLRILNTSDVRNAREIMRGSGIDLGTDGSINVAGVEELGTLLRELGMSEARIVEILDQIMPL